MSIGLAARGRSIMLASSSLIVLVVATVIVAVVITAVALWSGGSRGEMKVKQIRRSRGRSTLLSLLLPTHCFSIRCKLGTIRSGLSLQSCRLLSTLDFFLSSTALSAIEASC